MKAAAFRRQTFFEKAKQKLEPIWLALGAFGVLVSCAPLKKAPEHPPLPSKPAASKKEQKQACTATLTVPWKEGKFTVKSNRIVYTSDKRKGLIDFGFPLFQIYGCPKKAVGADDFTAVLTNNFLIVSNGAATAFQPPPQEQKQPVSEAFALRIYKLSSYPDHKSHKIIAFTSNRDLEGFLLYRAPNGNGALVVRGARGGEAHYIRTLPEDFLFEKNRMPLLLHHESKVYIFCPGRRTFLKITKIDSRNPEVYYVDSRDGLPEAVRKEIEGNVLLNL